MYPLLLMENNKKEIRANVQISSSSFLNKINLTLKQESLRVVTTAMICSV